MPPTDLEYFSYAAHLMNVTEASFKTLWILY